jgi:GNAT superfamily N-acetyltransferase
LVLIIKQAHFCDSRLIAEIGRASWLEANAKYIPRRTMMAELLYEDVLDLQKRIHKVGTLVYIAYYNNVPCGIAFLMRKHIGYLELDRLFIISGYRNFGIGYKLLELCKQKAKRSHQRLTLSALRKNIPARRFYERHGGVSGRWSHFNWNGFPAQDVWYTWK